MSIDKSGQLRWATSCGGPLVLLPRHLLPQWLGCYIRCDEPVNNGDSFETPDGWLCFNDDFLNEEESDYGRACAVEASRTLIKVGFETALVLDNEDNDSNPATWFPLPDGGGIIFQWTYLNSAQDQDELVQEVFSQRHTLKWENEVVWEIPSSELVLFDSATAGALLDQEDDDWIIISIQPGTYSLPTAGYYRATDFKLLTLHQLSRR